MPAADLTPAGTMPLFRLLVAAGLTATASEARRLCRQGGVTVDGQRQADPLAELPVADGMVLRAGKRRYGRVRLR